MFSVHRVDFVSDKSGDELVDSVDVSCKWPHLELLAKKDADSSELFKVFALRRSWFKSSYER